MTSSGYSRFVLYHLTPNYEVAGFKRSIKTRVGGGRRNRYRESSSRLKMTFLPYTKYFSFHETGCQREGQSFLVDEKKEGGWVCYTKPRSEEFWGLSRKNQGIESKSVGT